MAMATKQLHELHSKAAQSEAMHQLKQDELAAEEVKQLEMQVCLAEVERAIKQEVKKANLLTEEHQALEGELQRILVHQVRIIHAVFISIVHHFYLYIQFCRCHINIMYLTLYVVSNVHHLYLYV
jgi:hypothetical protein